MIAGPPGSTLPSWFSRRSAVIQAASASMKVSAGVPADANWPDDRVRFVSSAQMRRHHLRAGKVQLGLFQLRLGRDQGGIVLAARAKLGRCCRGSRRGPGLFVGAEFMRAEQRHAVRGLQLGHRLADGAVAGGLVHGIDGQRDVALLALERRVPVSGAFTPKSCRISARAAIPCWKASGKVFSVASGTPSALSP